MHDDHAARDEPVARNDGLPLMTPPPSPRASLPLAAGRVASPPDADLRVKEQAENFPVALRILPRRYQMHLRALYDVARVIDDLGDEASGDRTELLTAFRSDLDGIWLGRPPSTPVLRRLADTVRACELDREPFDRLVAANLQDQAVSRYATYADLADYCTLSADPVGRVVLKIFNSSTPRNVELSDRICTALQLVEHWQDVAEDRRAGRIYLPQEDLESHGVAETDLDRAIATPAVRQLMAFETARATELLDSGTPLVARLRGWARLAVAGYVAGGRAAIDAISRVDYDVLAGTPRPRRRDVAAHLVRLLGRRKREAP
jgi:squalene synthase HpnC